MEFVVDREAMLSSWGAIAPAIPTRSPRPILQSVRVRADGVNAGNLTASDSEISITHSFPMDIVTHGSAMLPTKVATILKSLRDDELTFRLDGKQIKIIGKNASFEIPSEDSSLFPSVDSFDEHEPYFVVHARDLKRLIKRTQFLTDANNTQYAIGGVCLQFEMGKILRAVATNGRCLGYDIAAYETEGLCKLRSPVIPVKTLKLIDRVIEDDGPPVWIAVSDNQICIKTENSEITSALHSGRFPNYLQLIPTGFNGGIQINAASFLESVELAGIATSENSRGVDFAFRNGGVSLAAQSADRGSSKVDLPLLSCQTEIALTMDPSYLEGPLKVVGDVDVNLSIIDRKNPVRLMVDEYNVILMPLTRG